MLKYRDRWMRDWKGQLGLIGMNLLMERNKGFQCVSSGTSVAYRSGLDIPCLEPDAKPSFTAAPETNVLVPTSGLTTESPG